MKKNILFALIFALIFPAVCAIAKEEEVPPWMEALNVSGTARVLVPKGAQNKKVGDVTFIENIGDYTARRLMEMENKLADMNKVVEKLKGDVDKLRNEVKQLKNKESAQ